MKAGIFKQFLRNRNLQKYFVLAVKLILFKQQLSSSKLQISKVKTYLYCV